MKRSNSDIVYDYVRKNILEGKFPPGYSLQANDLANKTGVSRTPVKDALRQLETDGLVVIQNRIGARVRTMEEKEFRELCELRLALEGYAAGLAARNRTLADLNEINAALQTMITTTDKLAELADSESLFSELLHGDLRFHITIISAAKNETIKSQILQLHVINRVMARPVPVQRRGERWTASLRETIRSHTAIFEAIKAGNVTEARARMEEHIQEVIDDHTRVSSPPAATGFRELTDEEMNYMALLPH